MPRFPDGLTVMPGEGRWRQADGRLRAEQSRIVLIVTDDTPAARAGLAAIRDAYRTAFAQDAVGLALGAVCASFR